MTSYATIWDLTTWKKQVWIIKLAVRYNGNDIFDQCYRYFFGPSHIKRWFPCCYSRTQTFFSLFLVFTSSRIDSYHSSSKFSQALIFLNQQCFTMWYSTNKYIGKHGPISINTALNDFQGVASLSFADVHVRASKLDYMCFIACLTMQLRFAFCFYIIDSLIEESCRSTKSRRTSVVDNQARNPMAVDLAQCL